MAPTDYNNFPEFQVTFPHEYVAHVEINRPKKLNSFAPDMWDTLGRIFTQLSRDPDVRSVVLSGAGDRSFTAGLDVNNPFHIFSHMPAPADPSLRLSHPTSAPPPSLAPFFSPDNGWTVTAASSSGPLSPAATASPKDTARKAFELKAFIAAIQASVTAIERCAKPVVCLMHGYSFGAAIDISTCADIRLCAADTQFSVKEVDIGLAADVGTLTRLPKQGVPLSWVKEVAYTARVFGAAEALRVGFVSEVLASKAQGLERAMALARDIAQKSPVAVQGTKRLIEYSRDHATDDGLDYTAVWNAAMLQTEDVQKALMSGLKKTKDNVRWEKL